MNESVQKMNVGEVPRQEDLAALRVLDEIERNPGITQREISRRVGVSLGLTNLLIRRMARKAWIKITTVPGRRLLYALTPRGLVEKIRKARDFVRLSLRFYGTVKESIVRRLQGNGRRYERVAVLGAGELSEIVAEAIREAGSRPVDADQRPHAILAMGRLPKEHRESWERQGVVVIDFS